MRTTTLSFASFLIFTFVGMNSKAERPFSSTMSSPICGDGKVDPGEECDDANQDNNDACVEGCKKAVCGDSYVWTTGVPNGKAPESCDQPVPDWETCNDHCFEPYDFEKICGKYCMLCMGNWDDFEGCYNACTDPFYCFEEGVAYDACALEHECNKQDPECKDEQGSLLTCLSKI